MLKQHARAIDVATRLLDLVLLTIAVPISHFAYVSVGRVWQAPTIDRLWLALVVVLLTWVATAASFEVYGTYRTRSLGDEFRRVAKTLCVVALVFASALFYLKYPTSRLLTLLYFAAALSLVGGSRVVLRRLAHSLRACGYNSRRYAVVGVGPLAEGISATFAAHPHWGFQLAGFILPSDEPAARPSGPVLGTLSGLERILDEQIVDKVVFAVARADLPAIDRAILLCEEQGIDVMMCLDLLRVGDARMSLVELADRPMLVMSRVPSDAIALTVKRAFDILVSAVALAALSPLLLAIAVAIRLDSRGPILFRQQRSGRNGRPFTILKFRSMYADAEERLAALRARNEVGGPVFKMRRDPRVTRVGRVLRKTSLDELPQFWNVLVGDMSVVGPRPAIPSEVKAYKRWQRRRLSMKPGITCTWQVSGRNDIAFERWMELDLEYIDNWTLWRDVQICLKTVPAVLSARGVR